MQDIKNKIEALLFTTGNFMGTEEIARLCSIGSVGIVKEALQDLKDEYEKKSSALTIFTENEKFKLGIKKEFNYLTTQLLTDCELDNPTLNTLAIIAYKQPILQSYVIKVRGNSAYDHLKLLRDSQFIIADKHGRTRMLKLAPRFFDYFDIVEDQLKSKFENVSEDLTQEEIDKMLKKRPNRAAMQIINSKEPVQAQIEESKETSEQVEEAPEE